MRFKMLIILVTFLFSFWFFVVHLQSFAMYLRERMLE